jgi:hypothetical protein
MTPLPWRLYASVSGSRRRCSPTPLVLRSMSHRSIGTTVTASPPDEIMRQYLDAESLLNVRPGRKCKVCL